MLVVPLLSFLIGTANRCRSGWGGLFQPCGGEVVPLLSDSLVLRSGGGTGWDAVVLPSFWGNDKPAGCESAVLCSDSGARA